MIIIIIFGGFMKYLTGKEIRLIIVAVGLFLTLAGSVTAISAKDKASTAHAGKMSAKVAIIIDDVGYLRRPTEELLRVPAHLTFSVLPFTPYGRDFALEAHRKGYDVMLHLPMQTLRGRINPGKGVIPKNWPEARILRQLDADIEAVPGLEGVNNHMGSAGPRDRNYLRIIMGELKKRHLFYVDSVTDRTVAEECAREVQIPFAKRDVFIDHFQSLSANESSLKQLIGLARKKGYAIGIGHAREGTATEILAMLPEFKKEGVEIVSVAELVK